MDEHSIISVKDCAWWEDGVCVFTRIEDLYGGKALTCDRVPTCTLRDAEGLTGEILREAFEYNHNVNTVRRGLNPEQLPSPYRVGTQCFCPFDFQFSNSLITDPSFEKFKGWDGAWQKVRREVRERLHKEWCPRAHLGDDACRFGARSDKTLYDIELD